MTDSAVLSRIVNLEKKYEELLDRVEQYTAYLMCDLVERLDKKYPGIQADIGQIIID